MGEPERRLWINLGWFHISAGRSGFHACRTDYFHIGAGVEKP